MPHTVPHLRRDGEAPSVLSDWPRLFTADGDCCAFYAPKPVGVIVATILTGPGGR